MVTETEKKQFDSVESAPKPTLVCVGTVGEIEDGYIASSGKYIVQPVNINALDSGKNQKIFVLYRPEWFVEGFKVKALKEAEGERKGAHFVYAKNIRDDDEMSTLRGLSGSEEAFENLMDAILNTPVNDTTGVPNLEDVTETFRTFFANNKDENGELVKVGYVLQQQRTKTDETTTAVKNGVEVTVPVYRLENRYTLANKNAFFDATVKNLQKWENRAAKSEGKFVMTYSGVPY